jgi:tetratricopeptide (TPR) repeat protein
VFRRGKLAVREHMSPHITISGKGLRAAAASAFLLLLSCSPATREASFLKRGKFYLEKHDYERAALEFRNAQQLMPKDAEAYYQDGLAQIGLRNAISAYRSLSRATQLDPKHVGARVKLAEVLSTAPTKNLLMDGEQYGKEALELAPDDPDALNALAVTELRLGNPEDAVRHLQQALAKSPQHVRSSISLAIIKVSQGDFPAAEAVLKQAVSKAPRSVDARIGLSELYALLKRVDDAERAIRGALEIEPGNGTALLFLARIQSAKGQKDQLEQSLMKLSALPDAQFRSSHAVYLLQTGNIPAAIAELERLRKKNPDDRNVRTRLVQAYLRANRLEDANKILATALQRNRRDVDALLQKAEIAFAAGKIPQARQDAAEVIHPRADSAMAHLLLARINAAEGDFMNSRQELTEALRFNPNLVPARVELARSYIRSNSPAAALSLLEQAPNDQKNRLPVVIERNWALFASRDFKTLRHNLDEELRVDRSRDLLLQDAALRVVSGDLPGARLSLEETLKQSSEDVTTLQFLAQVYVEQKQPAAALEKVRTYATKHPKSAPMQHLLGLHLLANGKPEEARAAFLAAKAASPKYAAADLALAQLDRDSGKPEAARKNLLAMIESHDISPEGQLMAHLIMGDLESVAGNHAAEIEHWRKVVESDSRNVPALNNLAYALLEHANQPDEALKFAQRAAELAPDSPDVQDTVGWAYYRKGIYATAAQHLQFAVTADGKDTARSAIVRKYHLAMACLQSGDRSCGMRALEAALKLNADMPEAEIAESVLAQSR